MAFLYRAEKKKKGIMAKRSSIQNNNEIKIYID